LRIAIRKPHAGPGQLNVCSLELCVFFLGHAHQRGVDPPSGIACRRPHQQADRSDRHDDQKHDDQRDPRAMHDTAEEVAAQVSPKLTVVMILTLMPCIFMILLGPAAVKVLETFSG
jgi:hypothetical protein